VVSSHGNYGRSKVVVSISLELEVSGKPENIRSMIVNSLADEVERLRNVVTGSGLMPGERAEPESCT
jgi:hypothetical protein